MERLKDFDLHKWVKIGLIELLEQYPNLFEMSKEELNQIAKEKCLDAQYHVERANVLEDDALVIERYCEAKYGKEGK